MFLGAVTNSRKKLEQRTAVPGARAENERPLVVLTDIKAQNLGERTRMCSVLSEVLRQDLGSGLVKPSQILSPVLSGFSITTNGCGWHWFHQASGQGLEWIA